MDKDIEEAIHRLKRAFAKDRTDRVVKFPIQRNYHQNDGNTGPADILKFEGRDDSNRDTTSNDPPSAS